MNLKNKLRKFFTLSRRSDAGFTLVELIVVIAILAILAGVGTVGYSGYMKKANMTADRTLVSDVVKALELAMYSDPFEDMPVGVLVLSTSGIKHIAEDQQVEIPAGSELDNALTAAFGAGYKDALKLKYDDWEVSAYLNGLSTAEAVAVKGSSYLSGNRSDMLLTDVEIFTKMAANLAGAMEESLGGMSLGTLFTDELLDATATKYGIEGPTENETWDTWGDAHPQEFSNLLVLATALDSANMTSGVEDYSPAASTGLILEFSIYYAFAATCPEFSTVLTKYMDAMNVGTQQDAEGKWYTPIVSPKGGTTDVYQVTTPSEGAAWYRALEAEAGKYTNEKGMTFAQYTAQNEDGESAAYNDQLVFAAIMSSLNKTTAEDIAGDMGNANLFTDGAVRDVYDQYMNTLNVLAGSAGDLVLQLEKGQIGIIYSQGNFIVFDTIGE